MSFSIGKCSFNGEKPSRCRSNGTVTVYYNGSVSITKSEGVKSIWTGNGDVCVILGKPSDVGKHEFRVDGNVQICHGF